MAEDMEDITPTNDGGILKKILHSGVGSIVPPGASVEGEHFIISYFFNVLL